MAAAACRSRHFLAVILSVRRPKVIPSERFPETGQASTGDGNYSTYSRCRHHHHLPQGVAAEAGKMCHVPFSRNFIELRL
jgi:hypothetical protein